MLKNKSLNIFFKLYLYIFLIIFVQFGIIIITGLFMMFFGKSFQENYEYEIKKTEHKIADDYNIGTFPIMTGFLHNKKIGEMAIVNIKKGMHKKSFNKFLFQLF